MADRNYRRSGGFNNRYDQGFGGYQQRGNYDNSGYRPQPKKKSGCKFVLREGTVLVSGWIVRKGVMYSIYGRPYEGTKESVSKNGKTWMNYFVTITPKGVIAPTVKTSGMFEVGRNRLHIEEHNLICTDRGQGGTVCNRVSK